MTALARFKDVYTRAQQGDADALERMPEAIREVFAEGRAVLTVPIYRVSTWAYKHGPRRRLRYGESLAMRGDGVVRREARTRC